MRIKINELTTAEPFKSLFPIEPDVVAALTADMKATGFDAARTIIAWKAPDGQRIVVDGHMRLLAAKAARLKDVHATVRRFADEDEAFAFAVASQRDRRNLTKLEIAEAIARAETARSSQEFATPAKSRNFPGKAHGGGSTKDPIRTAVVEKAAKAGVGTRTADKALANVRAANGARPKAKSKGRPPKFGEALEDAAAELHVSLRLERADVLALLRVLKRFRKKYGDNVTRTALPIALRLTQLAGDHDAVALYDKEAAPISDAEATKTLREIGGDLATALTPTTTRRRKKQ
jgi:ParB-like chromosome segregation protein Spo0J